MLTIAEVKQLATIADTLPTGAPLLDRARARVRDAARIVSAAVEVDPTLLDYADYHHSRSLAGSEYLFVQVKPMAKQAFLTLEHARLTEAGAPPEDIARLGKPCLIPPGGGCIRVGSRWRSGTTSAARTIPARALTGV